MDAFVSAYRAWRVAEAAVGAAERGRFASAAGRARWEAALRGEGRARRRFQDAAEAVALGMAGG